ncbi:52 kDa repressor of the inhibitor of the protein kinase-like [Hyperolius riggenbachi]|uniref:52 kDa repressor of the inhibitor of the protein kinase-like n=1 Tax=Hyperolius riggenbachi TaxID=752182 RepID=UPI0035A39E47
MSKRPSSQKGAILKYFKTAANKDNATAKGVYFSEQKSEKRNTCLQNSIGIKNAGKEASCIEKLYEQVDQSCTVTDEVQPKQSCTVTEEVQAEQSCTVTEEVQAEQSCTVTEEVQAEQSCTVTEEVQAEQSCTVTEEVQAEQSCTVTEEVQAEQSCTVTEEVQAEQSCTVTEEVQAEQSCTVTEEVQAEQSCTLTEEVPAEQNFTVTEQTQKEQSCIERGHVEKESTPRLDISHVLTNILTDSEKFDFLHNFYKPPVDFKFPKKLIQNIALRGHRDSNKCESINKGNFKAILEYRSEGDSALKAHLKKAAKNATYTSAIIQNEIIEICGKILTRGIVSDVQDFFSVIADETADFSNKEQLVLVIRFVSKQNCIKEEFLQFIDCSDGVTGQHIANQILSGIEKSGLNVDKLRGQGYDGAGSMAGKVKGAAAIISAAHPKAVYGHCCSHVLNLAIMSASSLPIVRNMFGLIDRVHTFFDSHPKRQTALEAAIMTECPVAQRTKLKSLCRTRWIERHHALETFLDLYPAIVNCFQDIYDPPPESLVSWSRDTVVDAKAIFLALTTFDHIIALTVVQYCMSYIKGLTISLQAKANDIVKMCSSLDGVISTISAIREDIDNVHSELFKQAVALASRFGVTPSIPRRCPKQTLRSNIPAETTEIYFRRILSVPYLDYLITELKSRFANHQKTSMMALTIVPSVIATATDFPGEGLLNFISKYEDDLPSPRTLHAELQLWKNYWKTQENLPATPYEALLNANDLAYPNITTLLRILCVLPVTTCEAERCFSSLKLLKTHLRSTMGQNRMNGLAQLYIHSSPPAVEEVLKEFMALHKRRMELGTIDL